jgi:predicted SAM-dependent methyltransferase
VKQFVKRIPILNRFARYLYKYLSQYLNYKKGKDLRKKIANTHTLKLVIGAAGVFDTGWIDTDIEFLNLLDPKHWEAYFQKDSIDALLAEHVWEHLTTDDGLAAAKRCFEYLKPGGYLRVAVPDGFCPDEKYINDVKPGGDGIYAYDHKVLYNHLTFADIFERSGFRVVLLEYYDSKGKFHFTDWNPEDGQIRRSMRFDERNKDGRLRYTSLILDAHKNI